MKKEKVIKTKSLIWAEIFVSKKQGGLEFYKKLFWFFLYFQKTLKRESTPELMLWYSALCKITINGFGSTCHKSHFPPAAKQSIDFSWPIRLKTIFSGQKIISVLFFNVFPSFSPLYIRVWPEKINIIAKIKVVKPCKNIFCAHLQAK